MTTTKNKIAAAFIMLAFYFSTNLLFGQTTQEEFNYITKGYKIQVESGLDMKKGYSLTDLGDWGLINGSENRTCEFKGLVKQGQIKPCAIMMIYKRTDIANGANFYICIPSADASQEIWQQTLDFINANFKDNNTMMQTVIWALMKFSSQEVSK
jgi:hypothetical protein